ncbi:MAG: MG2 domain-containing protein [Bacteroidales bacterium]
MKSRFVLLSSLITIILIAFTQQSFRAPQQYDYDKAWKAVEESFEKGLPKTAAQTIDQIRQQALAHNNQPQLLKSIIYQFRVLEQTTEYPISNAISFAKEQMPLLSQPAQALLHSIIAEQYTRYYQQNRYILLERPELSGENPKQLERWSLSQLRDTIQSHYEASFPAFNAFDTIPLADYKLILSNTESESIERIPTLFDLLTQRALSFYLNADAGLNPPQSAPEEIDQIGWLPAPDFALARLPKNENHTIKALRLMQPLLRNNLSRNHYTAYVHNDLQRLQLVYELAGSTTEAAKLYQQALQSLINFLNGKSESTEATAALAQLLIEQQQNQPDTAFKGNNAKALELCEKAIKAYPESPGSTRCKSIKAGILQKHLQLSLDGVNLPNQVIPLQLTYKNITNLYLKIIRITSEELTRIRRQNDLKSQITALNLMPEVMRKSRDIPFESDYEQHQSIIDLPALNTGLYVVLASHHPDFNSESSVYADFQISRLSFVQHQNPANNRFFVLDRETGEGIKNAEARLMIRTYDYTLRDYKIENFHTAITDKNGFFRVDQSSGLPKNQTFYVELNLKGDTLYSDNFFDLYTQRPERKITKTWFFTDRAIYRPGQTVYFKGITLEKTSGDYTIPTSVKSDVELRDANNQLISTLSLATNDYGSFEGRFVLPQQGLNGRYTLRSRHGSTSFNVEAYKRPEFEVKIEKPVTQYKLGETLQLQAEARAFAGFPLDSVTARYTIERRLFYPVFRYWWGIPPVIEQSTIIGSGKTITDSEGKFIIPVELTPTPGTNARLQPSFHFTITAEIIDKQGEMQSASLMLPASYQALQLQTNLNILADQQKLNTYQLQARNLQNEATEALVIRKFYKLEQESGFEPDVLMALNDRQLLTEDSLKILFPHWNFYPKDPDKRSKTLVYTDSIQVKGDTNLFPEAAKNWSTGEYFLVMEAKDHFGETVENETLFSLFNPGSKEALPGQLFLTALNTQKAQPGELIQFTVGTDAPDSRILVEIYAGDTLRFSQWLKLDSKQQQISYTVQEADRGKLSFQAVMVRYGRVFTENHTVEVPFDNRKLEIELLTLRDQLEPGGKESWELIIRNTKKKGIQAELLAAMYDASLDQIMPHQWNFNLLPNLPNARSWSVDRGFFRTGSSYLNPSHPHFDFPTPLALPEINYFGLRGYFNDRFKLRQAHQHEEVFDMVLSEQENEIPITEQLSASDAIPPNDETSKTQQTSPPPLRTNFSETAFFYPQLLSDEEGIVRLKFTTPDALTRWKLMLLAHDKELNTGMFTQEFKSSKPLMIMGNTPRFYYEGDSARITARIVNTGDEVVTGIARLELLDATTMQTIDLLDDTDRKPIVKLRPGQSIMLSWQIQLNTRPGLLAFRFSATAGTFTDAEQKLVPVLTREKIITNRLAITVTGEKEQGFVMAKPVNDFKTTQLQLQITPNPVWFAIQSLPYLAESKSKNADQEFYRLYTNLLAGFLADEIPQLKATIQRWKNESPEAFWSELQKNPELKNLAINQTPWLSAAEEEAAQKAQLIELFNLNRLNYELNNSLDKLQQLQLPNGAWPWFEGMRESRFITRTLLEGFGKLQQLGISEYRLDANSNRRISQMSRKAYGFISRELTADYEKMRKENRLEKYQLSTTHLFELYALSFNKIVAPEGDSDDALRFFLSHIEKDWLRLSPGSQATAAIVLQRHGRKQAAESILNSLRERSLYYPELGRTWKSDPYARVSAQNIEDQSSIIAAFEALSGDRTEIDQMRQWLLSHKRTHSWNNSRSTAEAIYALLLSGTSWTETNQQAKVFINGTPITVPQQEAGTGFYQLNLNESSFVNDSLRLLIQNPNPQMLWGGLFHAYSQDTDQLSATDNPLKVTQKLFVQKIQNGKQILAPYNKAGLSVGDKITVQLLIQTDRAMDYVHLRHHRPAAAEPLNQLSGYQYHDGLSYYQSHDDTGTDFFIGNLPKGSFQLQLELKVEQAGYFSGGFAEIQSYYAPEFGSNTEGLRLNIKE